MSIVTEIMDAEAKPEQPAEIPVEELSESELEAQLDELDERAAGAAETIQTLEEIQEIIEQSLSDGGLSDTEVVVAVDSINDAVATSPVELDRVDLPTTESAKTLADRRERTQLVMESIGERIKEVGKKLLEIIVSVLNAIRVRCNGVIIKLRAIGAWAQDRSAKIFKTKPNDPVIEPEGKKFSNSDLFLPKKSGAYTATDLLHNEAELRKYIAVATKGLKALETALNSKSVTNPVDFEAIDVSDKPHLSFTYKDRNWPVEVNLTKEETKALISHVEKNYDNEIKTLFNSLSEISRIEKLLDKLADEEQMTSAFMNTAVEIVTQFRNWSSRLPYFYSGIKEIGEYYYKLYWQDQQSE